MTTIVSIRRVILHMSQRYLLFVIFNTAFPDSLRGALTLAKLLIECTLQIQEFFDFSEGDENSGSATIGT